MSTVTPSFHVCSVSWSAIAAGALVAMSVSVVLLLLGSALGLSTLSPFSPPSSVTAYSAGAVIWLIIMQWAASSLGGYLTGRLRTRWTDADSDEVFFRDTVHGLITWAAATILVACILTSTAGKAVDAAAATAQSSETEQGTVLDPLDYYVDKFFRTANPDSTGGIVIAHQEAKRILARTLAKPAMSEDDKTYLGQQIAIYANIPYAEADQRLVSVVKQARADKAALVEGQRTVAYITLFIALSMVVGAFIASVAAAIGGRRRDEGQPY